MNVAAEWLRSGKSASLDGIELVPLSYPEFESFPISAIGGQATAYVLEDNQNRGWILKKFTPGRDPAIAYIRGIRSLVPQHPGFESGSQRRVLTSKAVGRGFVTPEFSEWIEKTILMPRVIGTDWSALADSVRNGRVILYEEARVAMCRSLVSHVRSLESAWLSHRDLSLTNVFVDPATWNVHLIDWDALYHTSLAMPPNTTSGTQGYAAPFVMTAAGEDSQKSWCIHADRFAMALLCTEFLLLDRGQESTHDGGLFEQRDLYARAGRTVRKALVALLLRFPLVARLLDRALQAESFALCPSPDEWLATPPLTRAVEAPPLPDRDSVMKTFDSYMQALNEPPPAPPLPDIDFSAAIRDILAAQPPADSDEPEN